MPPTPPPVREPPRALPGFNTSGPSTPSPPDSDLMWVPPMVDLGHSEGGGGSEAVQYRLGGRAFRDLHQDEDVLNPPYMIDNRAGKMSDLTVFTDVEHYDGLRQYDTHNLYGMSEQIKTPGRRS